MKKVKQNLVIATMCLLVAGLAGCSSSTEQLNKIKKPAIVFSKHQSNAWYESPTMSIKDADGEIIALSSDDEVRGLIDKYKVGDTIK